MFDLQSIFEGFFNDKDITHDRLHTFALDNVRRMTLNNPGAIYAQNIMDTQAKADDLKAKKTLKTGDKGTQKGATTAKDLERDKIEKYLAVQMPGAVTAFGGKATEGFRATYPHFMDSFYGVTKEDFSTNVAALIVKANTYVTTLGIPFKDGITGMFATYTAANDTQAMDVVAVSADIDAENASAAILQDQLTDNVCDVAHNNRRSITAKALYFNENLLFGVQHKEIKKGTPEKDSETDICKIVYSPGKLTHFYNKGAVKLIIGMKLLGVKVGVPFTALPNETVKKAFSDYFTNGDTLYVINPEDSIGMYQLDILS